MDHRPQNPARSKGALVAALIAILVASLLPTAAFADHNPDSTDPCADAPSAEDFADYERARDTHQPSIDCALYRGVTSGGGTNNAGDPIYRPRQRVNREQMAQFIVNTIASAGYDAALPSGGGQDEFDDIGDSFARVAINRLARAGIVSGTGGNSYSPQGFVTRQQMASFIVQAARFVVGENHPIERDSVDRFQDVSDDNVHKENIEAGADAGLFQGTGPTTFSPGVRVLRDQMATFLVNQLDYTFNPDQAPPPYVAEVNIAETEVGAGEELTGDITGENLRSATASGCGLDDARLTDEDNQAEGIQFAVTIPEDQDAGDCPLTFRVTFNNNSIRTFTETITVQVGNTATVSLTKDTFHPGEALTGEITGSNVDSAVIDGCGFTDEAAQDRDTAKSGIQFSEVIPVDQDLGACTLTFTVTFNDDSTEEITEQITIEEKTGVTTRPELIAAEIVSTTATGSAPGTIVRYVFDEPVTGTAPDADDFSVYSFDASRTNPATTAQVESGNLRAVRVRFASITSASAAADLTVAGVAVGAVTDDQNQTNPEGSAPIGAQREETVREAGVTAAPDLEQVGPFRAVTTDTSAVDFHFDEIAYVYNRTGFNLVLTDGSVVNCQGPARDSTTPGQTSQQGGNGTDVITVTCPNPSSDGTTTPLSATNVARGYVQAETVSDTQQPTDPVSPAEPNTNPLQAARVTAEATTPTPDLVSAEFRPSTTGGDDTVIYTFDEVIFQLASESPVTGAPTNLFAVYDTTGAEDTAESATRGSNTRTVVATFEPGTLADAVGASVRAGAVTSATSSQSNRADEVGVTNSATRTITPGQTQAPDLVAVAVNPENGSAVFTFDEAVNSATIGGGAASPGNFKLWGSKGEQFTCSGVPGTSTFTVGDTDDTRNQVTCSSFNNGQATAAQVGATVLGSVAHAAVDDAESGTANNPEGGVPTTGGTGTPEA